ncbi:hypothetical protein IWQ62_000343 [Dispira parvispora]|uniref:Uncharacterized protein n=1 Tax=Dispira parvispora TaxID=1520584 RepID=A0A9W8B0D4_9FUNG|nr:hypothetical protein IWQ62_000343 [Dispira parvispora]
MRPNSPPDNGGNDPPPFPTLFQMAEHLFSSLGVQTPTQAVSWPSEWSDSNSNPNRPDPFEAWFRSFFSWPGHNSPPLGTDTNVPFDQTSQNNAQPFSTLQGGFPLGSQGEDSLQSTKALRNIILKPKPTSSTSPPQLDEQQPYPSSTPTGPNSYFQLFNHGLDQWSTLLQQLLTPSDGPTSQNEGFTGTFNSTVTTVVQNEDGTINRTTRTTDETGQETVTTSRLDSHGRLLDSAQESNGPLRPVSPDATPIDHNAILRSPSGSDSDSISHASSWPAVTPQNTFGNPFGFPMESLFSTLFDNRNFGSAFPKDALDPMAPISPNVTPASEGTPDNASQVKGSPTPTQTPQTQYSYVSVRTIYNPDGSVEHRRTTRRPDGTQEVFTSREDRSVLENSVDNGIRPISQGSADFSTRETNSSDKVSSDGGWLDRLKHLFRS